MIGLAAAAWPDQINMDQNLNGEFLKGGPTQYQSDVPNKVYGECISSYK